MFADFLGGARGRLLPASVPFRFFGAAVVFHVAAWALLLLYGDQLPGFEGGPGPLLSALHLVTLGVLAMTAMGAAFQLLPVATKKPLRSVVACKVSFWMFCSGLLALLHGMATVAQPSMELGGGLMVAGLTVYAAVIADNLRRVSDMRVVTDHAWTAMASLVTLALFGLLLIGDFAGGYLPDHRGLAIAHAVVAAYGFMGMLALGFSFVLVPMFGLSPPADARLGQRAAWLAAGALVVTVAGLAAAMPALVFAGGVLGLAATGMHLRAMFKVMKSRMKKQLGGSFVLIRLGWVLMPVSIGLGLAAAAGLGASWSATLFGFVLVFGWLLSFLTGVLQRILPFLASMYSVAPGVKPVLVSRLTAERPLKIHLICHCLALTLIAGGIVSGQGLLVRLGAAAGLTGAAAFAGFAGLVWFRLARHLKNKR